MTDISPQLPDLSDRVILVTGAGRGIGAAVAQALAAHKATVILLGRRVHDLEAVYDAIVAAGHPTPAIAPVNLEALRWEEAQTLIDRIGGEFGRLDGLLHNAAHLGGLTPLIHFPLEEWYRTLQVNLNAAFLLTQSCLPLLKASSDASILFTSDTVGRKGKAYFGAYGVSKFAIQGLMETLAEETQDNTPIRVNCIDPGTVRTELFSRIYPGRGDELLPLPQDIVQAYLYLLGPQSRGVTGKTFQAQADGPWQQT